MKEAGMRGVNLIRFDTYQGNMCQNPSGRILKNPAKYAFEIADAISKPIEFEAEFETLDVFQIL